MFRFLQPPESHLAAFVFCLLRKASLVTACACNGLLDYGEYLSSVSIMFPYRVNGTPLRAMLESESRNFPKARRSHREIRELTRIREFPPLLAIVSKQ